MTASVTIRIQEADFDIGREISALTKGRTDIGAVVSFSGICRGSEGGESIAALRVSVPVTKLAKWKTTIQLVAIGFLIAGEAGEVILPPTTLIGIVLLWISAIFTIYTGYDYFRAGIHHLIEEDEA